MKKVIICIGGCAALTLLAWQLLFPYNEWTAKQSVSLEISERDYELYRQDLKTLEENATYRYEHEFAHTLHHEWLEDNEEPITEKQAAALRESLTDVRNELNADHITNNTKESRALSEHFYSLEQLLSDLIERWHSTFYIKKQLEVLHDALHATIKLLKN